MCAQPIRAKHTVEVPCESEVKALARFAYVVNPSRLLFCNKTCQRQWHGLRRSALQQTHGALCACVGCMGK